MSSDDQILSCGEFMRDWRESPEDFKSDEDDMTLEGLRDDNSILSGNEDFDLELEMILQGRSDDNLSFSESDTFCERLVNLESLAFGTMFATRKTSRPSPGVAQAPAKRRKFGSWAKHGNDVDDDRKDMSRLLTPTASHISGGGLALDDKLPCATRGYAAAEGVENDSLQALAAFMPEASFCAPVADTPALAAEEVALDEPDQTAPATPADAPIYPPVDAPFEPASPAPRGPMAEAVAATPPPTPPLPPLDVAVAGTLGPLEALMRGVAGLDLSTAEIDLADPASRLYGVVTAFLQHPFMARGQRRLLLNPGSERTWRRYHLEDGHRVCRGEPGSWQTMDIAVDCYACRGMVNELGDDLTLLLHGNARGLLQGPCALTAIDPNYPAQWETVIGAKKLGLRGKSLYRNTSYFVDCVRLFIVCRNRIDEATRKRFCCKFGFYCTETTRLFVRDLREILGNDAVVPEDRRLDLVDASSRNIETICTDALRQNGPERTEKILRKRIFREAEMRIKNVLDQHLRDAAHQGA